MARKFIRASDQYLMHDAAALTAPPITMAGWMYPIDDSEVLYGIGCLGYSGNYYDYYSLEWRPGGPDVRVVVRNATSAKAATTTAGPTLNQWNHVAGIFASSISRSVFLNGGNKGQNTDSLVVGHVPNLTGIGAQVRISSQDWFQFDGYLAEFGLWNVALTDEEVAVLAAGYSPLFVRPQNLVGYWPLIRKGSIIDNPDIVGRYDMTDYNGPSDASHCRIIYPGEVFVGEGKPEVGVAVLMQHYRKMRVA